MNDLIDDEQTPLDGGGVPLPNSSTREEGEISESDEELDADFIRNAHTLITADLDREPPCATPARLTFSLPEARVSVEPEEGPRPRVTRPLDIYEQFQVPWTRPLPPIRGTRLGRQRQIYCAIL